MLENVHYGNYIEVQLGQSNNKGETCIENAWAGLSPAIVKRLEFYRALLFGGSTLLSTRRDILTCVAFHLSFGRKLEHHST